MPQSNGALSGLESNGNLSGLEVAAYLHAAGFGAGNGVLQTAVAIAQAESGWVANKRGGPNSDGTYDWGLMQINDTHKPSDKVKTDPLANAKEAHRIYVAAGNRFTPWSAYKNGSYRKSMEVARQSVIALQNRPSFEKQLLAGKNPGSPDNPISGGVEGPNGPGGNSILQDPTTAIAAAVSGVGNAVNSQFGKMAGNAVAVTVAVALLVLGVVILMRQGATNAVGGVVKGVLK